YIEIVREDGSRDRLERVSPGRGFSANVVFEGQSPSHDTYRARMTWERDHFKVQYRDGSSATYLPCNDFTCFWTGSQDARRKPPDNSTRTQSRIASSAFAGPAGNCVSAR